MIPKTVLIVEDEPKILEFTESYIKSAGYNTLTATNGNSALSIFLSTHVDLILLDLMLPDISGETICKKIREQSNIPIIMLTAKTDETSIINGLSMGADDYITKPFSPRQLVARVIALFRRIDLENKVIQGKMKLFINQDNYSVLYDNINLAFTKTEFLIFKTLASRQLKVFTRDELLAQVFDGNYEGYNRSLDSHIKNIRNKIAAYTSHDFIKTVRGIGYKFASQELKSHE